MQYIDTHTHIDGEEFKDDLELVVQRASNAGALKLFVPGINLASIESIRNICKRFPDYCYGMIGLHPEDVKEDYASVLDKMEKEEGNWIAIGEIGLDYYWSREFEQQQLEAFERQVQWAIERRLPLMIHCRKAQNEMVRILRKYSDRLPGGVFHCFTGNEHEAEELLAFEGFCLGIGGVLTFKKSNLPQTLANAVPLNRIVLETDAPYMAPVPHRGERNESAFIVNIIEKLADVYGVSTDEVANITTENARRLFPLAF
ncbi:MAG: TatD family hydrolase [Prevotella sp.]|nr:TatD family hydrolase [Candidatus Prevotella equi]